MSDKNPDEAPGPSQGSPLRARSQRERKRNPFIFNDDAETTYPTSLGGGSKLTSSPRKATSTPPLTATNISSGRKMKTPVKHGKAILAEKSTLSAPPLARRQSIARPESPSDDLQLTATESAILATVDSAIQDSKPSAGHHQKRISKLPQGSVAAGPASQYTVKAPLRPDASVSHLFTGTALPLSSQSSQPPQHHPTLASLEAMNQHDKKTAHRIGIKLRNLLKLPKAHKWVCYEWFYSNIDKPLFEGENDFVLCLKDSFPNLRTTNLTRTEWCKIRRLMGKPRRCSQAFFTEERAALMTKRAKIRMLQQRKVTDLSNFRDLPERIPLPLVLGMRVTARLRRPQDGLFTGVVEAVNTVDNTYRISFDRSGLGTHSVADFEVLSNGPIETMPLSAFAVKPRPKPPPQFPPIHFTSPPKLQRRLANDPFFGGSQDPKKQSIWDSDLYGGFPIKFLKHLVLLTKILEKKKALIQKQREMNKEAEFRLASGIPTPLDVKRRYAKVVLDLDSLNGELKTNLSMIQDWVGELAPDQEALQPLNRPVEIRRKCLQDAEQLVKKTNRRLLEESGVSNQVVAFNRAAGNEGLVSSEQPLKLVSQLTALMLQVKMLAEHDLHSFEFASIGTAMAELKKSLHPDNVGLFEEQVEVNINYIQKGLCPPSTSNAARL